MSSAFKVSIPVDERRPVSVAQSKNLMLYCCSNCLIDSLVGSFAARAFQIATPALSRAMFCSTSAGCSLKCPSGDRKATAILVEDIC